MRKKPEKTEAIAAVTTVKKPLRETMKKYYQLYLMLLPAVVFVAIFSYTPLSGWLMAFNNYQLGKSIWSTPWIGFKEFVFFFRGSTDAWYTVRNTVVMNLMGLFACLYISAAFAIMLNEVRLKKLKKCIQTASFFPYFVSWVICYMIFYAFFAQSSGVVNQMLVSQGILKEGINFLGSPSWSWWIMLFVGIWLSLGYDSVIFLSAIAGIDTEQYEAADIDGATRWQKIRYITAPELKPTLVVLLILNSGNMLGSNLESNFLFCNATNRETMETLDMYIYEYGLAQLNIPYATAVCMIRTIVSICLFLFVNHMAKKYQGTSVM